MNDDDVHKVAMRIIYEDSSDFIENVIKVFTNSRSDLDGLHPSDVADDIWATIHNCAKIEGVDL